MEQIGARQIIVVILLLGVGVYFWKHPPSKLAIVLYVIMLGSFFVYSRTVITPVIEECHARGGNSVYLRGSTWWCKKSDERANDANGNPVGFPIEP